MGLKEFIHHESWGMTREISRDFYEKSYTTSHGVWLVEFTRGLSKSHTPRVMGYERNFTRGVTIELEPPNFCMT
nr:MAG: hypothetical protein TU36_02305 [Vulcanisaeta sp. AZ3]